MAFPWSNLQLWKYYSPAVWTHAIYWKSINLKLFNSKMHADNNTSLLERRGRTSLWRFSQIILNWALVEQLFVVVFHSVASFVVQMLSCVQLFVTPWPAACQNSLSFTISQSLLKFGSIKLGVPSNHLILSSPCPPALSFSQHQGLFQWICSSHQVRGTGETELQHHEE